MKLTEREAALAAAIGFMGFAFTTRTWLLWLNELNPIQGIIVYYVILYCALYLLSRLKLVVFGITIDEPIQTIGLLMVTFAFFSTGNCYV
jgi:RsiW-degrading membrane proteinase PrsW (M82 family)